MKKQFFASLFCAAIVFGAGVYAADAPAAAPAAPATAVSASAPLDLKAVASMQALVPDDALIVFFANGGKIAGGKLFPALIKACGPEIEAEIKKNMEQNGDANGICIAYVSAEDLTAMRMTFAGAFLLEKPEAGYLKKGMTSVAEAIKTLSLPIELKTLKLDDKDVTTVLYTDKDDGSSVSAYLIQVSDSMIQFCIAVNPKEPLKPAILPAKGNPAKTASMLDLNSSVAFSVNVEEIFKKQPAEEKETNDPLVKEIKVVSFSVREDGDFLPVTLVVNCSDDAIPGIKAQIAQAIEELKENAMFSSIAQTVKVTEDLSHIRVSAQVPSALILANVQAVAMAKQAETAQKKQAPAESKPAPAAK